MNKLVLIGNGFDLAHGLKTKYTDFLIWYVNRAFERFISKPQYDDGLMKWFRYNGTVIDKREFSNVTEFMDCINFYSRSSRLTYGFKHSFFQKLLTEIYKDNWVDIEEYYYSQLIKLYKAAESRLMSGQLSEVENDVDKLNECFYLIKKNLEEYLIEIDSEPKQKNEEINKHISSLIQSTKIDFDHYKNTSARPVKIHFLNFNYTSTIGEYIDIEATKAFCKINYIHGKLGDKKNPIIFGYGDEMDTYYEKIERLNSNTFLKNIKSFGYFRTSNYQDFSSLIDYRDARFEVHLMGHSCGLSDRILLNSIFEHPNCVSIRIYYHQKTETENDFFEKTQAISRHFTAKGKEKMRKTIVPFPSSVPLTGFKV